MLLNTKVEQSLRVQVWQERNLELLHFAVIVIRLHLLEDALKDRALFGEEVHDGLALGKNSVAELLKIAYVEVTESHEPIVQLFDDFPVQELERHVHHYAAFAVVLLVVHIEQAWIHI